MMAINEKGDWEYILNTKITEVLEDATDPAAFTASITSPNDPLFALTIDHTLLKPDATPAQIDELCEQAILYNFKSCCVNPANVKQVAQRLAGYQSIPCSVIGFPLGASTSKSKAFEAAAAVADGAKEIDMVLNIGALKSKDYPLVFSDIKAVVDASGPIIPVKVILETVFLTEEEKVAASYIAAEAGAAFVKTCTGFSGGGATAADVALMRKAVAYKPGVKVKASAGIRSFEKCMEMFRAGAERIGTSSGAAIVENAAVQANTY